MSHRNYNKPYESPREQRNQAVYRSRYSQSNKCYDSQWHANSRNSNWANDHPVDNFGTNNLSDDQYCRNSFQQQSHWDGNYPARDQPFNYPYSSRYSYSTDPRNRDYKKKYESNSSKRPYPYKRPKLDFNEENWGKDNNKNPQTSDHTKCNNQSSAFKNLLQSITAERQSYPSKHKIQEVWYSKGSSEKKYYCDRKHSNSSTKARNDKAKRSSRSSEYKNNHDRKRLKSSTKERDDVAANISNVEVRQKSIISLTNDDTLQQVVTSTQKNLHDKEKKIDHIVNKQNKEMPKMVLKKSSVDQGNWSVKSSIKLNHENFAHMKASETGVTKYSIGNNNNHFHQIHSDEGISSASPNSFSKTTVSVGDQNQLDEQNKIMNEKKLYRRVLVKASFLDAQNRELNREFLASLVPVASSNSSLHSIDANPAPFTSSKDAVTSKSTTMAAISEYKENAYKPGPCCAKLYKMVQTDDIALVSTEVKEIGTVNKEVIPNSDTDLSDYDGDNDSSISLDEWSPENTGYISDVLLTNINENCPRETSDDEFYDKFSSSDSSSSFLKRSKHDEEFSASNPKRPKIIQENTNNYEMDEEAIVIPDIVLRNTKNTNQENEEIIEISDDDASAQEVKKICSSIYSKKGKSKVLKKKIVSKNSAQAKSTSEISKGCQLTEDLNFTSKYQKLSSTKSKKQPTPVASNDKIKQLISSFIKKRLSIIVKKTSPTSPLPSHEEGKLRNIINNELPIVLLKRLTPAKILKFSAKHFADKSTLIYQKDALIQLKYFVSFIYFYSAIDCKVSLISEIDDPKDLCNKILHISNEKSSILLTIKYLKEDSDHRITYKALSNPMFDIKKMYKDFLDFRRSFEKLDNFFICTNFDLSTEAFEKNGVKVEHKRNRYKFSVKEDHELYKKFLQCLALPKLAELLAQCFEQGKQNNFNTLLIKKYHLALVVENVLLIYSKKGSNGKQTHVAKLHPYFISQRGISSAAKELHRHLLKSLRSHELSPTMEFVLTSDQFGKDTNLDPNPDVDFIRLANALVYPMQHTLLALKNDLKKIMGHVLQKEESNIYGFKQQFFSGHNLPGNLKRLRMQVKILLEHEKKNFLEFCNNEKFLIKDFCNDYPVHKLPDENSETLFKEFFKCFAFAKIEQYAHILHEDISKINDEACMNAVQEELLERIRIQNLGEESLVSIKNLISKCNITSALCKQLQPMINIEFDKRVLDTLQRKLPKRDIVLCITKCLSLTSLKVKQLCTNVFKFTEGKESLFITNKILLEMKNDVLKALAHSSTNLLVVQWSEPIVKNSQVQNVFTELMDLVKDQASDRLTMKSVIIIGDQENCSSIKNMISNKIIDDKHSFDLSEDSKAKLLRDKNVFLQYHRLSFKPDLLLDEHVAILLDSPEIVRQLLTGKLSIGKDLTKPYGYKECHFKTQIKRCIIINPAIFHEQIEDVFIIRNVDRKDLEQYLPARQKVFSPNDVPASMRINARFILLGFNIPPSFFDGYAEKNQEYSVHLLRYESGSFVWEKTKGNNKHLLRNRLDDSNDLYKSQSTEDVIRAGPKTVIICGESGSGKSVCLFNLAKETRNLYKNGSVAGAYWPVQVNLDKARLSKHADIRLDLNIAIEKDFVAKFLCNYLEFDEVQSKLLTMVFHNELKIKLVIFFDNYEELPPSQRNFVIQLLQELQISYCEQIHVTCTPSTRSQLEDALAVFAYTLEFSEVEKIQFLQSFWSKSVGDIELIDVADSFIDFYSRAPSNDGDLTTTPLHLKMLAGIHKLGDEDYTDVEAHDRLYKLFVEHKGIKDKESASLYSLHKILDQGQLKTLNLQHKYPKKGFVLPDDLRHRTFYEYFSAKWLATKNHSLTIAKCINDLLDSVSPLFFKTYLAELNDGNKTVQVVSDFAVNGHLNVVKAMLAHCKATLQLSTVIASDNPNTRKVVKFLLDHYNDTEDEIMLHGEFKKAKYAESSVVKYVNRKEKPGKETPLEVAARMKNIPIACELLLKGANIKGIVEEFVFEIARYVAKEMCYADSTWLHPIAEKLFKLQPGAVVNLNKTKEYPCFLAYFFTHGRVELVNLLLKNDRERYNILEAKVDQRSPLDLVNESRALTDEERLEMTKYIVSNVGEDLEKKNKYYLAGALKTAAECNHERTFEYFIGKYPEKHMGFLESAMKSNRLDLIRFLMRKSDRMMYPHDNTALHKAVSLGVSPITINFLVNRGGIDNKNKSGETPLCVAFKEGRDLEMIEYLIKKDAHLFAKDELGLYPWCYAILDESKYSSKEQMTIMKCLQEKVKLKAPEVEQKISFESDRKRKEVSKKFKFFQKPESFMLPNLELHMALKSNDESWIRFLILQGANVNHKEADGRTPLHVAIEFKRYKLAKMLLGHGAMFNAKDKNKVTPLELLSRSGDDSKESKEIKVLLENAMELFKNNVKYSASVSRHLLNSRDKYGHTLLHIAARNGNKTAIKEIIKHSKDHCIGNKDFPPLDVNARDAKGRTALYYVKSNNVDVANELLVNGAIFEPTTALLKSAEELIQAVKDKDVERVKELIKNEYLVNARDESGKSCLHWAASYDSRDIMQLVLSVRASDVDAMDLKLQTPLHYAAHNDNIASVFLLLKAGASYDVKNKQGYRPFDLDDKANESFKLLVKIHQMFVDIKSDDPRILVNENPDALADYLSEIDRIWHVHKDIVVNVMDHKKNTLMHIAAKYDFTSVVENLLRHGAIYNPLNKWRQSPESMATSTKQLFQNITKAREKLNVNSWVNLDPELVVNFRFNNGYTLLHDCVTKGKKEEVRWLIENGADVKSTSKRGSTIKCDRKKYPTIAELLDEL